jgi:hypothetical protein
VVRVNREEERLGGAANVAVNVKTLGAQATLLTVVSGLILTFRLMHGPAMGNPWMVVMQVLGMLGGLLALTVLVPTAAKLTRIDPIGEHAAFFDRLRARQWMTGLIAGVLGLVALLASALYRHSGT